MKRAGFFRRLIYALAGAFVLGYMGMCIFWFVSGMKYGIDECFIVYRYIFEIMVVVLVAAMLVGECVYAKRRRELSEHLSAHGYDDEYYVMLEKILRIDDETDEGKFQLASAYIEGGRFDKSREVLETVDFGGLTASQQDEYFNILLFGTLKEGNVRLANSIYSKARLYFERALLRGRCGNVIHTMGLLFLENGALYQAEQLFMKARLENDKYVRCECDLCLGEIYLETGREEFAKKVCYNAAEEVCSYKQAVELRALMIKVENSFCKEKER